MISNFFCRVGKHSQDVSKCKLLEQDEAAVFQSNKYTYQKNLGVLYKASQNVEKHSNKLKYNCDENIQCLNVAAALSDSPIVTLLHTILCRMRRSVLAVVASVDTCSLVRCSSSLRLTR